MTITRLLKAVAGGDVSARDQLYRTLYLDLSRIARAHIGRATDMSLDAPALVHESYLRIEKATRPGDFLNRKMFLGYASAVMRNVIVDYLRERQAAKRGGDWVQITLNTGVGEDLVGRASVLEINDALSALAAVHPRCQSIVEMRYFGGLTEEEIASVLDISVPTVKRDWRKARAFLFDFLQQGT